LREGVVIAGAGADEALGSGAATALALCAHAVRRRVDVSRNENILLKDAPGKLCIISQLILFGLLMQTSDVYNVHLLDFLIRMYNSD
jgi:hypothetical protein